MTDHAASGQPSPRLEEVLALLRGKVDSAQQPALEAFVRRYYAGVDPEDLDEREVADLYGAALSHWNFGRRRTPGQPSVRALNPSLSEQGWQSTHTVIEIVNDDMPFLVDSVTMEVNRHGLTLHLIVHPILEVRRSADGALEGLGAGGARESWIHVEVDRVPDTAALAELAADIARVLGDVRAACADWQPMRDKLHEIAAAIAATPPPLPADELAEGRAFLDWLADNHFTLLGYRCHDLVLHDGVESLRIVPGSGLGILHESSQLGDGKDVAAAFAALPPAVRAVARKPELLVVTKSNSRSTVHRPGYLDYIAVKRFDGAGQVCGEHRFLGLFTSTAYSASPQQIPLLRRKAGEVIAQAGLVEGSHAAKALVNILDNYPRDELFQTDAKTLARITTGILHLGERQRFRLFVRPDPYGRFVSCLIYAPRENYTTVLRKRWQQMLVQAFNGSGSEFNVHLSESVLARIQITVKTTPGQIPAVDEPELEARLAAASRGWDDELKAALLEAFGEARGNELLRRWAGAFPVAYRDEYAARNAVPDIDMMSGLGDDAPVAMNLYRPLEAPPGTLRFKLLRRGEPLTLSASLPMLEHMGMTVLDEHPHRVQPADGPAVWIDDFGLRLPAADADIDIASLHGRFEEAFGAMLSGAVESDDFNRLVIGAALPAGEITVLRAYARYMRQIGFALSQPFIEATLAAHAPIARALVELFKARFDPAGSGDGSAEVRRIEAMLEEVTNLSEDRVLRQLLALMLATTRTNFWRGREFLSFKFDPSKVPGLPQPKPMFEIFVYSPRFEGVHLRGGPVARGGLRWSDRPEDFRTEVLGLVKAQMVKNTVIVPVGSKGGFVLKRAPSPAQDREGWMKEGIACYKNYLRGLLDVTDNRVGGQIVPPPDVRRHDADDPYLVVAADKGTATFSDHANAVSAEYGFWLADAFASGGSAGYDHKGMGITARGAWESAKRHFRELGHDTQRSDFTVAGIGDMSGDVFGNGMLLSRHIRLVAAFDHRHVFIDPNPDAARSHEERQRLFALPRSSWADYDAALISEGGGVHARSAKSVAITPQVRAALGLADDVASLTPTDLVNAVLKAPVDLVYNGGIGTYVKASSESHEQVGDRANDALRVDGRDLRCKVFVEGGNLGCTQRGRIEYALAGGRINTDAIDNSAGVDTSDHEVNIKILLGLAVTEGELTTKQRNTLLPQMTDDVAALVLSDNIYQTQVLSVIGRVAPQLLDAQTRFMHFLEKAGRLNRDIEFLPNDDTLAERRTAGLGLARPEQAVLLAYSKMWLYDELLASPLPDDPWVATALERYFPTLLRERFAAWMPKHPLKREIIATQVTNSLVNRVGPSFVYRLGESTGARPHEVVRACLLAREVFGLPALWQQVDALDNQVDDAVQAALLNDASQQLERGTTWFLRSRHLGEDMAATIAHFAPAVEQLAAALPTLVEREEAARIDAERERWAAQRVPAALAQRAALLDSLVASLDIAEVAAQSARPVDAAAATYFEIGARLGLPWLRRKIAELPGDQHWRMLAKAAMQDDLAALQRSATRSALAQSLPAGAGSAAAIETWEKSNARTLERTAQLLGELRAVPAPDDAMLSVTLRELRALG